MTCIVGLVHEGDVWIGGDSAAVGGLSMAIRADRKVFRNGEFIAGFTSSFRMGQLLAYAFTPPKRHADVDPYKFMVTEFVNGVRECLKQGGFATNDKGVESGGVFLVGYAGRLFRIDSDYQVGETLDGYTACGCGEDIALGSLGSTVRLPPKERVTKALALAERHSAGVRAPFHTVVLKGDK